ncbi:helix-turn-helix domain-containing protein [Mycolicibacterium smegmatis]|uniref:helix-turn-helix domain-containing protein n=1 Tax=Mycolicibacterium smegmatis TaxID=1772 RepID=UPI001EFAB43E|nr:helix-turn-helix domain-containing protein [Mycolicibacterium smegmatis]ULN32595.1 helix-turn-helix domain-containing protein [Mycolicibacterium smegmatis]
MENTANTATAPGRAACPVIRRGPVTVDYLRAHPTVSVEQAALLLGISKPYAYQLARTGELDSIELGAKRIRIKSSALLRMLGEDGDVVGRLS